MSAVSAARDILFAARNALARTEKFNLDARARLVTAMKFKDGAHARLRDVRATLREIRRRGAWR